MTKKEKEILSETAFNLRLSTSSVVVAAKMLNTTTTFTGFAALLKHIAFLQLGFI
jgi:hypothetical protein